ncbi:MAG TPA: alpha/beta fold hydrolase [Streptosporangiaceae bacterium]
MRAPPRGRGNCTRRCPVLVSGSARRWPLWRGPSCMARAVADLEDVRRAVGVARWVVLGHSWGSDLAVRYALDHPGRVAAVVGTAGHGLHKDRSWPGDLRGPAAH